jgi:methionyl-tRNA formyltransferase
MGAAALAALVAVGPPVAVVTAEPALGSPPVAAIARAHGLNLAHADRLGARPQQRWGELVADLDVAVCACWAERLAPAALALPARGWINLHPSALPAWRGADPVAWQLLAAPARIGCSVHRMTPAHDDGPVLAAGSVPVGDGDDRGAVLRRSGARLGQLAAGVLADLAAGAAPAGTPQPQQEATRCPPPGTVPLIDPRAMSAAGGARVARAFSPEPGVAVAALSAGERFAVSGDGPPAPLGAALADVDAPGEVDRGRDGRVAIAFTDRWLSGWGAVVGGAGDERPSRAELSPPGATRLPRGGR